MDLAGRSHECRRAMPKALERDDGAVRKTLEKIRVPGPRVRTAGNA